MSESRYDVALSFAGEDRDYVEMVADQLRSRGLSVFYDEYEKADLWGKDLYTHLSEVYMRQAHHTIMFISIHYRNKIWTNHERRAAQARALQESREYILPARFDDTEIPGLLPTTGYLDLRKVPPAEVAVLVCQKIGLEIKTLKANTVPSPHSPSHAGEVRFKYRSHDGRFRIGKGLYEFETAWSAGGTTAIHCYNDPPSIQGIAIAQRANTVTQISDAASLDFSSRVRTPHIGQILVLRNSNGFYAAIQIVGINNFDSENDSDELHFRYWILADGKSDFSSITNSY